MRRLYRFIVLILLAVLLISAIEVINVVLIEKYNKWGATVLIDYVFRAYLIDLIFFTAFFLVSLLILFLAGLIPFIKKLYKTNILWIAFSLSTALTIVVSFSYPINHHFLPRAYSLVSIVVNALLFLLAVPISIGIYHLGRILSSLWRKNSVVFISVCVIVGLLIVGIVNHIKVDREPISQYLVDLEVGDGHRPNILVLTFDALRPDHLSCYGYNRITTPSFDSVAEDGVMFKWAFCNATQTAPSVMTMMSSQYPTVHGRIDPFHTAREGITTLAQILKKAGYNTNCFVYNPNLMSKAGYGWGFDVYEEYGDINTLSLFRGTMTYLFIKNLTEALSKMGIYIKGNPNDWMTEKIVEKIKSNDRFLIWAHFLDPHHPYTIEDRFFVGDSERREYLKQLIESKGGFVQIDDLGVPIEDIIDMYDSEILQVDCRLARIVEALKLSGKYDDTVIIITADHGEELEDNKGIRGHGTCHYMAAVRVPMIVKFARSSNVGGIVSEYPVSHIDIAPTILGLLDISDCPLFAGEDIRNNILMDELGLDKEIYIEGIVKGYADLEYCSLRNKGWCLITTSDYDELYYEVEDRYDHTNLIEGNSEIASKMKEKIGEWKKGLNELVKGLGENRELIMSEEKKEEMRGLGYIQ
ncbi:MAG: hypothetical protein B6D57_02770 [Candidatus Coatesbacteria bacterium 4484_99]|uniref:Sulfatase N-terminal domain-containing protein n=1 Tax=Candidatus Coatesbacteria bacterium 4484_99 TaxID=1970774 RepID=A0A1W9S198_9BACT|nr:MAG: hypothetical protein B6D57_02770 [Candidatus Coatesbacteria bacterium 4484_99]